MTKDEIIRDFDEHLKTSNRRYYSEFYVGITNDIENRLFTAHRVPRKNHWWIYSYANTESIAREVEKYYLKKGMRGGTGGGTGTGDARYVYCYVVTSYTVE